jgi:hypothetical protein
MDAIVGLSQQFGTEISHLRSSQTDCASFWLASTASHGASRPVSMIEPEFEMVAISPQSVPAHETLDPPPPKPLILGPLLDASPGGIIEPFMRLDDFEARRHHILKLCQEWLSAIQAPTAVIHAVSGLNGTGHRLLSYPQQLQITIDILQAINELSRSAPVMVSFDNPWGERLSSSVGGMHPLQIADSLLRHGVHISYLGLDVNLDYWPGGSAVRDPLQWIDLVDIWSQLGLPLVFCLRVAQQAREMPTSAEKDRSDMLPINRIASKLNDQQRMDLLRTVIPMLIARPAVLGVIWRQWQDADDPRFPGGGLYDDQGNPKSIVSMIQQLRDEFLIG